MIPFRLFSAFVLSVSIANLAQAASPQLERSLQKLEPHTRMREVCDLEVAGRISKQSQYSGVDRVVSDARHDSTRIDDTVNAKGAAFRRQGKWYALQYSCTLSSDHMKVGSLRFTIGKEIPEPEWEEFGLWR
ncbi:DUF930 domain-containing protein [Terrihabitans sp. B22-R8]|uniref:DUF930 domain-containing protein n=1 Tax=Terrihabitans sp. B22-R8 TaxID=3425128 RepID=UPI00403C8B5E